MTADILAAIDGSLRDYETSRDAMRWNPGLSEAREPAAVPAPDPLIIPPGGGTFPVGADIFADVSGITEVFRRIAAMLEQFGHDHRTRRDRIRCRECHPQGNPGPLAVNGHEYRRRQRARARRRHGH